MTTSTPQLHITVNPETNQWTLWNAETQEMLDHGSGVNPVDTENAAWNAVPAVWRNAPTSLGYVDPETGHESLSVGRR